MGQICYTGSISRWLWKLLYNFYPCHAWVAILYNDWHSWKKRWYTTIYLIGSRLLSLKSRLRRWLCLFSRKICIRILSNWRKTQKLYQKIKWVNFKLSKNCYAPLSNGNLTRIFKVQNSKYVGGAYGKSSELALMDELYKNGPIVVSFEPDEGFNVY